MYRTGQWFYFPAVVAIKSTIGFLALLAAAPFVLRRSGRRELVFLLLPALAWLAACLPSKMNLGVRHILPMYAFLIVLAAATATRLAGQRRWGRWAAAALLLLHVASSARVFPNYLTYANEAFGGSRNTYRLLSDSNADWGQGLKSAKRYLDAHGIHDCWFAHYGWNVNPAYYHIPCKPLPSGIDHRFGVPLPPVPPEIEGTLLISGSEADGNYWDEPNPYAQFLYRRPNRSSQIVFLCFKASSRCPCCPLWRMSATHGVSKASNVSMARWRRLEPRYVWRLGSAKPGRHCGKSKMRSGQPATPRNEAGRTHEETITAGAVGLAHRRRRAGPG